MRNDYYKRMEHIIQKSKDNPLVRELYNKTHSTLQRLCKIESDEDRDTYNLVYMWMTYNYSKPDEQSFIEAFCNEYQSLKGEFAREKALLNKVIVRQAESLPDI